MGAMSELDIVAQEHGIDAAAPDALIRALDVIRRQDDRLALICRELNIDIIEVSSHTSIEPIRIDIVRRDAPKRVRHAYPKCQTTGCGHSVRSHNDLGYCQVGTGTMHECHCDGFDDGLRRQPDGTRA